MRLAATRALYEGSLADVTLALSGGGGADRELLPLAGAFARPAVDDLDQRVLGCADRSQVS
jgi:hypothetical protein